MIRASTSSRSPSTTSNGRSSSIATASAWTRTGVVASDLVGQQTGAAGAIVVFKLESGLILALYPRTELAKDAAVPAGTPQLGQFSLGQLVASRAEVDRILEQAAAAGAVVTPPHDRPWGIYSGCFRDPDGHLWEIIWNPGGHQSQTDLTIAAATKRALRDDHGEHGKGQRPECSTHGFSPHVVIALTAVRCRACRSPLHPGSAQP